MSIEIRAGASENLFGKINELAEQIGMQVNCSKTQMLCVHPCVHNEVSTYIKYKDDVINSTQSLKILGFNFNSRPNATYHVEKLVDKFYGRLWTLRFLRRSGMEGDRLLEIYNSMLRSAVEYSSVVYHSMITAGLSEQLEKIQRQALRIIYGWDVVIEDLMMVKGIQTLQERREKAVLNFALKNEEREKYGKKWFRKNEEQEREVRPGTRRKYITPQCRTERYMKNPITYMTRMLNEHYNE